MENSYRGRHQIALVGIIGIPEVWGSRRQKADDVLDPLTVSLHSSKETEFASHYGYAKYCQWSFWKISIENI